MIWAAIYRIYDMGSYLSYDMGSYLSYSSMIRIMNYDMIGIVATWGPYDQLLYNLKKKKKKKKLFYFPSFHLRPFPFW